MSKPWRSTPLRLAWAGSMCWRCRTYAGCAAMTPKGCY